MNTVRVPVLSNGGLTKDVYEFEARGLRLVYYLYSQYNRSTLDEPWRDEVPSFGTYEQWCEAKGLDPEPDSRSAEYRQSEAFESERRDYYGGQTTDGRWRSTGQGGQGLREDKPLPPGVPEMAKAMFLSLLEVDGE